MGSGEKQQQQQHNNNNNNMINFHINLSNILHHNNSNKEHEMKGVPKGCMAILVGHEEEEELQRFIIPIIYVKHPLFIKLLKEAEEEYGFKHDGPITIPCNVDEFLHVQDLIDQEQHHHHHHAHGHGHHHEQHHHNFLCF